MKSFHPHEELLTVTTDCVVLQTFFKNSQNNFLPNFTKPLSETGLTQLILPVLWWSKLPLRITVSNDYMGVLMTMRN